MPWVLKGKCVHKKNADGSAGELIKCHDTEDEAKRHMRALYANVHDSMVELSMAIVKTSIKDGEMRWRSVNSDTGEDYYEEHMSKELFEDMTNRIDNKVPVPVWLEKHICEEGWCGGMPYVSLAHFKSANGKNVPGEVKSLYVDGDKLKSTGILYDNRLGQSVYRSLSKDVAEKRKDKVRISIGFIDLEHSHGDRYTFVRKSVQEKCPLCSEGIGDKIYKKGILVHLALTRQPANPRTDIEVERSMNKLEDAKSIVDDEEVLEDLELKSLAEDVLVVKSEEEEKVEEVEKTPVVEEVEKSIPEAIETPEVPATPLDNSLSVLRDRVAVIKSQGLIGDEALRELQPVVDELGTVLRAEFTPKPTPEQVVAQNVETTLRSMFDSFRTEMMQALSQTVAPMQAEVQELRALAYTGKPVVERKKEEVPQPRSLSGLNLTQKAAVENLTQKVSQFAALANVSVGLPENYVR